MEDSHLAESNMEVDPNPEEGPRQLEFYQNYTEIICDTVNSKRNEENKHELVKRQDKSEFKHTHEKWTKVFSLDSNALLCLSIQGEAVEITVKHLFHSAALKNHEALKERYSGAKKQVSQTKKYLDHSSELLHQAVLQKLDTSGTTKEADEYVLYYCSKDFKVIYCVKLFITDTELTSYESKQAITEDYSSIRSFTISHDSVSNTNIFFFASEEFNGVLVSNPVSFGRKDTNERISFSHVLGQANIITSGISSLISGVAKRIARNTGDDTS